MLSGKGTIGVEINSEVQVSEQYAADTFSTWYVFPGSTVNLQIAADSTEDFVVFFAAPI